MLRSFVSIGRKQLLKTSRSFSTAVIRNKTRSAKKSTQINFISRKNDSMMLINASKMQAIFNINRNYSTETTTKVTSEDFTDQYHLTAESEVQLGLKLLSFRDFDAAIAHFETALNTNANYVKALKGLGICHMRKGTHEKAKEYFNKVLSLVPTDLESRLDLIVCDFEQKKDEAKAVFELEKIIKENPSHLSSYKTLAALKLSLGKYAEAVDAFSKVLQVNPQDIDALTFIGTILGKTGEVDRAMEILRKAIELIEQHNKEVLYGQKEMVDQERQDAVDATTNSAGERKFVDEHTKGILGFEESKLPSSGKKKRQIADVDDDDAPINQNLSQGEQPPKKSQKNLVYINDVEAYIQLSELVTANEEREQILRKAHETNPQNELVVGRLAQIEAAKGNRDEATRHIQRALLLNPSNAKLYEICGSASLMLKNFNESLEYFQRAISLDKNTTNLIVANLMSHGGSFVEDHTDYESGSRTFEILVKLFPSPTEAETTVRNVLKLIGDEGPELSLVLVGLAIGANRNKLDDWADRWANAAHKEGTYKELKDWAQASAPNVGW